MIARKEKLNPFGMIFLSFNFDEITIISNTVKPVLTVQQPTKTYAKRKIGVYKFSKCDRESRRKKAN